MRPFPHRFLFALVVLPLLFLSGVGAGCVWVANPFTGEQISTWVGNDAQPAAQPPPGGSGGPSPPSPPNYSLSRYVVNPLPSAYFDLGFAAGERGEHGIVILAHGRPDRVGTNFGAKIPGGGAPFMKISDIEAGAKEYARGFYLAAQANHPTVHIRLAVGTSNYIAGSNLVTTSDLYNHGRAWAEMVWRVQDYLVSSAYAMNVTAYSANDFEMSWSPPAHGRSWIDGYASVTAVRPFARTNYNFGNAPCFDSTVNGENHSCPVVTNFPNDPAWTQEDIWYVSYAAVPAQVLPEIYHIPQGVYVNGIHAWHWQQLSLYAHYSHDTNMQFAGTTTQWNACIDNDFTPDTADNCVAELRNEPADGWLFLYNQLKTSSATSVAPMQFSTDMDWPPPP